MKRLLPLLLALSVLLTGCSTPVQRPAPHPTLEDLEKSSIYVESMDTLMTLSAYGSAREAALEEAEKEILRLNDLLSVGVADSEISQVNAKGSLTLSDDTAAMVEKSLALYQETDGAFDITIYPIMDLWGFTTQDYHVPTDEELADTLARVGADRLDFDAATGVLTLDEGQAIDLGGIAKGFTSQRVMEEFQAAGVTSGIVSLGGNVHCLGTKPDGSKYRVGIQDPNGTEGGIVAVVEVADAAVITSGGYERFFVDEESGLTYQHIIDPATGIPVDSDLLSVSILSNDGMLADGLSTSLYIMGLERACDYWRSHSDQFQAIFIDRDNTLWITAGLEDAVSSDADIKVVK